MTIDNGRSVTICSGGSFHGRGVTVGCCTGTGGVVLKNEDGNRVLRLEFCVGAGEGLYVLDVFDWPVIGYWVWVLQGLYQSSSYLLNFDFFV